MRKEARKRPWLAAVLSLFFPGLGQLYNRQFAKAAMMFGLVIAIRVLSREPVEALVAFADAGALESVPRDTTMLVLGYSVAALLVTGISVYDAHASAGKINLEIEENKF